MLVTPREGVDADHDAMRPQLTSSKVNGTTLFMLGRTKVTLGVILKAIPAFTVVDFGMTRSTEEDFPVNGKSLEAFPLAEYGTVFVTAEVGRRDTASVGITKWMEADIATIESRTWKRQVWNINKANEYVGDFM